MTATANFNDVRPPITLQEVIENWRRLQSSQKKPPASDRRTGDNRQPERR